MSPRLLYNFYSTKLSGDFSERERERERVSGVEGEWRCWREITRFRTPSPQYFTVRFLNIVFFPARIPNIPGGVKARFYRKHTIHGDLRGKKTISTCESRIIPILSSPIFEPFYSLICLNLLSDSLSN